MLSAPAPTGAVSPGGKAERCQLADREVHCLAKALYDNVAEAPDELAFRKGDVLVVLEQNTNGLEGWWLCSLRGRQGIAPGNRLRLMPGMYDPSGIGSNVSPHLQEGGAVHARRRSWKINPNRVVTPQKVGDVYMYDVPVGSHDALDPVISSPQACKGCQTSVPCCSLFQGTGGYDTPPSPRLVSAYDEPRPASQQYDLPKPHHFAYDKPRCHSALQNPCNLSPRISSPCSLTKANDYDVPNSDSEPYDVPGPPRAVDRKLIRRTSDNSDCIAYDVPIPSNHTRCNHSSGCNELPLSQRSSGVSMMSSSSMSMISPASSESSLNTSLSLSSICGSNRSSMEQQSQDMYDIPPPGEPRPVEISENPRLQRHCFTASRMSPSLHSTSRNGCSSPCFNSLKNDAYKFYETPPAPRPAQACIIREGVYDVPPQVTKDVSSIPKTESEATNSDRRFSSSSTDSREFKENFPDIEGKELPLDLDGAMERLVRLHEEVQSAISRLFSFVSATWRKRENMETKIFDIKTVCHRLCSVLEEFLSFVYGALANSTHSSDRTLCHKLGKLVMPLNDSNSTVQNTTQALDDKGWQVNCLSGECDSSIPDELDQLVACARILVEDVRQVASFIQGNCTLIFKRCTQFSKDRNVQEDHSGPNGTSLHSDSSSITNGSGVKPVVQERPLPTPPQKANEKEPRNKSGSPKDLINDYDYVNLESKESVEKENEEIKASLPKQLHKCFDNLVKQSHIPVDNDMSKFPVIQPADGNWSSSLEPCDLQVFKFYTIQYDTHLSFLTNAIDAFLYTIENNQPPKVFIGHSKFVVISAHKLVYIGDTVHRNITHTDLKGKVLGASNTLCEALKSLVLSTKKAALQFPSVVAVQEMVDSVVDVSHLASALKTVLNDACSL